MGDMEVKKYGLQKSLCHMCKPSSVHTFVNVNWIGDSVLLYTKVAAFKAWKHVYECTQGGCYLWSGECGIDVTCFKIILGLSRPLHLSAGDSIKA